MSSEIPFLVAHRCERYQRRSALMVDGDLVGKDGLMQEAVSVTHTSVRQDALASTLDDAWPADVEQVSDLLAGEFLVRLGSGLPIAN